MEIAGVQTMRGSGFSELGRNRPEESFIWTLGVIFEDQDLRVLALGPLLSDGNCAVYPAWQPAARRPRHGVLAIAASHSTARGAPRFCR
jgi:hypothetical protein